MQIKNTTEGYELIAETSEEQEHLEWFLQMIQLASKPVEANQSTKITIS